MGPAVLASPEAASHRHEAHTDKDPHHVHATWGRHAHGSHPAPPGTDEERAARVAELRAALPDPAAVDAQLRAGGEEGVTDAQLARWLAARGWCPERAAHDLAAHAAWRAEYAPAGRVLPSEVPNDIAQRKVYVQGPDARGRACVVFVGKNHNPRSDIKEIQRFFCFSADAAILLADPALNPGGKVQFVFMSRGFGWSNFDIPGLSMLFRMIQNHYVERLETMYIHGCSAAFQLLFNLVSPFIDPVTRRKVVLLPRGDAEAAAVLERDLGREVLPPLLGGTAEPRPVEEAWALIESRGILPPAPALPSPAPVAAAAAAPATAGAAAGDAPPPLDGPVDGAAHGADDAASDAFEDAEDDAEGRPSEAAMVPRGPVAV